MRSSAPVFREYDWGGGREWMMSFGPKDARHRVLILPPLLEELNRTRKFLSDMMRTLAAEGVASHLPDLPGAGESVARLADVSWNDWRNAAAAAASEVDATAVLAVRGGCLLDDVMGSRKTMRFAPVEGRRLVRDLIRARSLTDEAFDKEAQQAVFEAGPTLLGGYPISSSMASSLRDAMPDERDDLTTVRIEGEHGSADAYIAGTPLWRRAEPSGSPEMAEALASAIADWLAA